MDEHLNSSDKSRERRQAKAIFGRVLKGVLLGGSAGALLGGMIGLIGAALGDLTLSATAIIGLRAALGGGMIWAFIGALSTAVVDWENDSSHSPSR